MNSKPMILILEDQFYPTNLDLLTGAGYDWRLATTAKEGVELLQTNLFQGVFLDIMLPPGDKELAPKGVHSSMGGITVLERILAGDFDSMGNGPDLPVVVVSAVALPEVKERVRNLLKEKAARRYLMKPIDFERIIEVLQSAITQRRECHGKY